MVLNTLPVKQDVIAIQRQARKARQVSPLLLASGVAILLSGLSPNPFLTALAILVIPVILHLLWRPGEPPVIAFAIGVQWLQVATVLLYADFTGTKLTQALGGEALTMAVFLGLIGLVVLAAGARLGCGRLRSGECEQAERKAANAIPFKLFASYLVTFVTVSGLQIIAFKIPGITQLLTATLAIKWIVLYLLVYSVLQSRQGYSYMWIGVAIEFASGLLGYFSGFKSVFLLLLVVLMTSRQLWTVRKVVLGAAVFIFLIVGSIVWSAVKMDYREFLNEGTHSQVELVPVSDRIDKLGELVSDLTNEGMIGGFDALISRVGYVTYFADTIENVPANIPFEYGGLWWGAVRHVLIPRLIDPEKPDLDDSAEVRKYTGLNVAGEEQGTTISLGYMTESYIDFGSMGMFAPIFLLGLLYGLLYRGFVRLSRLKIIGFAAATSVLVFSASLFETSNAKILGGVLTWAIVAGVFVWIAGSWLTQLLGLER